MALTSEELFQAMQIVAEEVVTGMGYDKTILCKIVDNSQRETGKYMVSDGSNTFPAYTESNYSYGKNVWVYVTIPQGNYENKKIIIGKYTGEDEAYTLHINPYSHLVDMTGPINITEQDKEFNVGQDYDITQPILDNRDLSYMFLNGCNRIGLNFKVKTNGISAAVTGIYGIAMRVSYILEDGTEDSTILYTSCNDFYGPIYNFEALFPQEMLFTLPSLKHIQSVSLQFFQDRNFKDKTGKNFIEGSVILSDIQLHIGYDIDEFGGDSIMLYTNENSEYSSKDEDEARGRNIYLKWIKNNDGIGEEVELVPEFTTVTWYRQFIQEIDENETREHDGYWFVIEPAHWNETSIVCRPDAQNERLKVVIETPTQEALATYNALVENNEDVTSYINTMEKQVLVSQINFTNTTDVSANLAVDLVQAVTLVPQDSYKGIYNIYGADGKINNNSDYYAKREIVAEYLSLLTGDKDYDGEEVAEWKIPKNNTMIYPPALDKSEESKDYEDEDYYYIYNKPIDDPDAEVDVGEYAQKKISFTYRIKDIYNQNISNNTMYCRIRKNGRDYFAQFTFTFGTAGTNGTDYTLNLSLSANSPAYITEENYDNYIEFLINLYNYQGEEVATSASYSWYSGSGDTEDQVIVSLDDKLNILKATAKVDQVNLESYLPIPSAESDEYLLSGPTRIIYDAQGGNPIYEKQELKLLKNGNVITDIDGQKIKWRMVYSDAQESYTLLRNDASFEDDISLSEIVLDEKNTLSLIIKHISNKNNIQISGKRIYTSEKGTEYEKEELIFQAGKKIYSYPFAKISIDKENYEQPFSLNLPTEFLSSACSITLGETTLENYSGIKELNLSISHDESYISEIPLEEANYYPKLVGGSLQAASMFYSEQAISGYEAYLEETPERILWRQPLLIIQNRFGNSMLNKWDGALEISDESGSILGATFAAGKKEIDNSFTGIIMGQTQTDKITSTGLYSYQKGAQVFSVDESGIVKIGRSGGGQITIDGAKSQIESGNHKTNADTGMLIDMKDGYIHIGNRVFIDSRDEADAYFKIKGKNDEDKIVDLISIDDAKGYYLQTADYNGSNKGLKFDLKGGGITAYSGFKINSQYTVTEDDIDDSNNAGEKLDVGTTYNFKLDTGNYTVIDLGINNNSNFKIKQSGYMEAKAGTIGGWNISSNSLNNTGANNSSIALNTKTHQVTVHKPNNNRYKMADSVTITYTGPSIIIGQTTLGGKLIPVVYSKPSDDNLITTETEYTDEDINKYYQDPKTENYWRIIQTSYPYYEMKYGTEDSSELQGGMALLGDGTVIAENLFIKGGGGVWDGCATYSKYTDASNHSHSLAGSADRVITVNRWTQINGNTYQLWRENYNIKATLTGNTSKASLTIGYSTSTINGSVFTVQGQRS